MRRKGSKWEVKERTENKKNDEKDQDREVIK